MYNNIKSKIITPEVISVFFACLTGVRQGENISQLCFSVFLNDLRSNLHFSNATGQTFEANDENIYVFIQLFVLLFADDTVLFSNTKEGLQKALDIFEWKLTVNINKTKMSYSPVG